MLGLALYLPSASVSSLFMMLYIFTLGLNTRLVTVVTLPFNEPGGIGHWPGRLTIVLQCYDTVGWVIWPLKLFPKWGGMLNPTVLYSLLMFLWLTKSHLSAVTDYNLSPLTADHWQLSVSVQVAWRAVSVVFVKWPTVTVIRGFVIITTINFGFVTLCRLSRIVRKRWRGR